MSIWDFEDIELEDLYEIRKYIKAIEKLGFNFDTTLSTMSLKEELESEIDEREFKLKAFEYNHEVEAL